jgi:Cellulase (glycosyl hydrolase family 5)
MGRPIKRATATVDGTEMTAGIRGKAYRARRRGVRRGLLASGVLAGLLAASLGAVGSSPASAAQVGIGLANPNPAQIADVRALGSHWVRLFATWPDLEPARGEFAANWLASYDQVFRALPKGTKVIVDVVDTPGWESGSSDEHAAPANPDDYAAFVAALARRWAGRVSAYEIWNEEDSPSWWTGAPNPAAYAALLRATYPLVKAADPRATIVLGGLTGNDYPFLEGVYRAGAKGSFDAVGVHTDTACDVISPYSFERGPDNRLIPDSFLAYREVHATMLANGDHSPIWMTEMSWRTTTATCSEGVFAGHKPEGVSERKQATYLAQAYHCLAGNPYVKVALWFPIEDQAGAQSGLVRSDNSRKPSFAAIRKIVHGGDRLRGACGNFTGPTLDVASPANRVSYSGPLPIHVSAKSSQGLFRIRLEVDGRLIRNYDSPAGYAHHLSGTLDWQGAKHIAYGRHTLTFLAYDRERNVSVTRRTVYHLPPSRHGQ